MDGILFLCKMCLKLRFFARRWAFGLAALKMDCRFGFLVENKAFLYMGIFQTWAEFCIYSKMGLRLRFFARGWAYVIADLNLDCGFGIWVENKAFL